ncbi:MAG: hypothetical protein E3K36_10375 [Candidatus Brocadia sp.]|nr:hypothetical protein [Candidatus Brocadia sp.]
MLHRKFLGVVSGITFIGLMVCTNNFIYAGEEVRKQETHKHSEKALAPVHPSVDEFVCPSCKEVRVSPEKGRTLATMKMVCPDCKNEIKEFAVHHCDKCGKDVLVCMMCQEASAKLKAATMEGKCPKCKQVRRRPVKGKALAGWEMKCPECKKKTEEWLVQHCDECGTEFLSCPICLKEQEKAK